MSGKNPARAKLLRVGEPLEGFRWSSYPQYLKAARERFPWLRVERVFGELGIPKDSPAGRRRFAEIMEGRREKENDTTDWKAVRRGWCLGDKEFKAELLEQMHGGWKDHYGEELGESEEAHAERLLQGELRRRRWKEGELPRRRKGDPAKLTIAWRLRQETTMTLKWIAERLHMGRWTYLSNCLLEKRKQQ